MSRNLVVWWVRQDQRLHDNPALRAACEQAISTGAALMCLAARPPSSSTRWGFDRVGPHRRWVAERSRQALDLALCRHGQGITVVDGPVEAAMRALLSAYGDVTVHAQEGLAPEERAEESRITSMGVSLKRHAGGGLFVASELPLPIHPETGLPDLPGSFTPFRQALARVGVKPRAPLPEPAHWPGASELDHGAVPEPVCPPQDPRSIHPYTHPACDPSEAAALRHVATYLASPGVARYKQTRNAPSDGTASTRWSPWLASGALSPRWAWAALDAHEASQGPSEGSEWIRVELLWREYFRWLMAIKGAQLYRPTGLHPLATPPRHDADGFERWRQARTGLALVDAGMRELAATGWLSNRLRQICASALLHELGGDWRAGAAWFEAQLIDFDPQSNQGNWAYIAGYGTDPRGGRRFDIDWQTRQHDPDGHYRARWLA